ncbi:MAG: sigma-70 family RNA polymerase sigma factor [Fimbriimonadales bacterium]
MGRMVLALSRRSVSRFGFAKQEMDDLAQSCAVEVVQQLRAFNPYRGSFEAWISGFAWNVVRGYRSGHRRQARALPGDLARPVSETDPCLRNAIFTAMEDMLPSERQLLDLRFVMQLSSDEIAEFTSISASQARKRISRALERIRCHDAVQGVMRSPILG